MYIPFVMIQVDPFKPARTYISMTDPKHKHASEHEAVHGLTPKEVAEVIRRALIEAVRVRLNKTAP